MLDLYCKQSAGGIDSVRADMQQASRTFDLQKTQGLGTYRGAEQHLRRQLDLHGFVGHTGLGLGFNKTTKGSLYKPCTDTS